MNCRLVIVLALSACASPLFAQQQPRVLAPHEPTPQVVVPKTPHKPPVRGRWQVGYG